jgi:hypothetical protein
MLKMLNVPKINSVSTSSKSSSNSLVLQLAYSSHIRQCFAKSCVTCPRMSRCPVSESLRLLPYREYSSRLTVTASVCFLVPLLAQPLQNLTLTAATKCCTPVPLSAPLHVFFLELHHLLSVHVMYSLEIKWD